MIERGRIGFISVGLAGQSFAEILELMGHRVLHVEGRPVSSMQEGEAVAAGMAKEIFDTISAELSDCDRFVVCTDCSDDFAAGSSLVIVEAALMSLRARGDQRGLRVGLIALTPTLDEVMTRPAVSANTKLLVNGLVTLVQNKMLDPFLIGDRANLSDMIMDLVPTDEDQQDYEFHEEDDGSPSIDEPEVEKEDGAPGRNSFSDFYDE